MEKTRTQAVCVDLLKLIFAYCVVAIHTQAANKAPLYLQFWTALAVPFFFVCSGYYFQIKLNAVGHESVWGGVKSYFERLFRPFIIWGSWYLLLEAANRLLIDHASVQIVLFQLGKRLLISSPGGGLWYVQAILWMLGILYLLRNRIYNLQIFAWSLCALYVFNVVVSKCADAGNEFQLIKQVIFSEDYSNLNFVFNGVFFPVGMVLARPEDGKAKNILEKYCWELFAGTVVIWFLQGHFRYNMATAALWALANILRVVSLFLCAQRLQIGISPLSCIKMRKMSTRIYFLHFTAIYFVKMCSKIVGHSLNEISLFITCAAILTVVSYALDFDKLSWSKKLF